ncbi:MAG: hypothetical protein DRO11_06000 [Methanobacteriota archaeon]|nr:MAG: hypothetical protein DRO11_06000 [Euryarchaeota archaeon]
MDDVAIADVALEATGASLEEMFVSAAKALAEVSVSPETVEARLTREIRLRHSSVEGLLYDFLSELIFLQDVEAFAFKDFDVEIQRVDDDYHLVARVKGEPIDPGKHKLRTGVKAVTYHLFQVFRERDGWRARVVLDV